MTTIRSVAVLGAGTMGAGIAGVCANAGCDVLLLDLDASHCEKAKERLAGGRSPVVADAAVLDRIRTGSFDNDLGRLANCDWICEAVVEDVAIKRDLFTRVEAARADGGIVSTNTSGIPLRDIYKGMPERLRNDIAVTHFFNPVHIMKLVELVPGEDTRDDVITTLAGFLGDTLGKGVVYAKDTVNFIGNRIGCLWMLAGLNLAEDAITKDGLDIETVDALMSAPLGLPPTGLYGLVDLIGLDVMFNVGRNLETNLPTDDAGRRFVAFPENVQRLYDRGQLGRKTGGGFYKLTRHDDGSKSMEVFDLAADQWRPAREVTLAEGEQTLGELFDADSANGRFVRRIVAETLCYSADLVPEIADDIVNVDRAMRWGFGWQKGPFELIDEIGAERLMKAADELGLGRPKMLAALLDSGNDAFYRDGGKQYFGVDGGWHTV